MVFIKGKDVFVATYTFVTAWGRINHYLFLWLDKNETMKSKKRPANIFVQRIMDWEIIKGSPSVIVDRVSVNSNSDYPLEIPLRDNLIRISDADAFDSLVW